MCSYHHMNMEVVALNSINLYGGSYQNILINLYWLLRSNYHHVSQTFFFVNLMLSIHGNMVNLNPSV